MYISVMLLVPYLLVSTVAATCCLPPKWEGMEMYLIGSYYNGTTVLTRGTVHASLDKDNKKIAFSLDESSSRGYFQKTFTLQDFSTKTEYSVTDGKCYKSDIYDEFPSQCIPNNATVEVKSFVDVDQMNVTAIRYNIPYVRETHVTVLEDSCTPLSYEIIGNIQGANSLKTSSIYSFSPNIHNSSIFDVPASCKKATYKYKGKRRNNYGVTWFAL